MTGASIVVDSKGTPNGGQIHILGNGTLTVGSGAGALNLSAQNTNGAGGTIEIGYLTSLTVNAANLSVATSGNGNGGTLNLHDLGTISLSGNLNASGSGTGNGGQITITQTSYSTLTIDSSELIANSGNTSGNGGTITLLSGDALNITGSALSVTAANNGAGGTIQGTATSGAITLTGNLSAEGQGSGKGGYVTLNGNSLNLGANTIDVSAGPSGSFAFDKPNIGLTSVQDLTLATNSSLRAIGGAGGSRNSGGLISISSQGSITSQGTIDAHISSSGGVGGTIDFTAGSNQLNNGFITISSGQVLANSTGSAGIGGTINFNYYDPLGSTPIAISLGAVVQADQPATGAITGTIGIKNLATSNVGAQVSGTLSAKFGLVTITVPASSPGLTAQLKGEGEVIGTIDVFGPTGANLVQIDMGIGSVTIGQISTLSTGDVKINTATSYDILSDGSSKISANSLELTSGGNIGVVGGQALLTAVQSLTVTANSSGNTQNVNISNTNSGGNALSLPGQSRSSGSFQLVTNNNLVIGEVVAGVDSGSNNHPAIVTLQSNGTGMEVQSGVYNSAGPLTIQGTAATVLTLDSNAIISAIGVKGDSNHPGIVTLAMGTPVGLVNYTGSSCFEIAPGSLDPQASPAGFTANCPATVATILNSNMILYGPVVGSIVFTSNQLTAITPM